MKPSTRLRVPPEQLRWSLPPDTLGFETTQEVLPACNFTPGQSRAIRAFEIGLSLRGHGYNIFVAGEAGTQRKETVRHLLEQFAEPEFTTEDYVFVNNFKNPDQPRLIRLPAGMGRQFQEAMATSIARLQEGIPRIFQSEVYSKRRRSRVKRYSARMEELATSLKEKAEPVGLVLVQIEVGEHTEAELLPMIDGEPMAFEDAEDLIDEGKITRDDLNALAKARQDLEEPLRAFREAASQLVGQAEVDLRDLDRHMTRPYLNLILSHVYRRFQQVEGITEYLREVEEYLESRMALFRAREESGAEEDAGPEQSLRKLEVNLILDNADQETRPVLFENTPSLANLRGSIDRDVRANGLAVSDFTHIKAGSLIRAHNGFLVIHADDLDGGGRAWNALKRALRTGQVQIETESAEASPLQRAIRPQPVPIDVKVILIGTVGLYQALLDHDPDFQKVFKVKAEFDTEMELGAQAITEYACMVRGICDEDKLPPFEAEGVAAVIEHAVRLAGQRNRITTRFTEVGDLVREAAFWARHGKNPSIGAGDVQRALEERRHRVNLIEEKSQRMIREGVILIDTEGSAVGQINGLAVLDVGDHRFGRPTRITSSVSAGAAGVVNIERRAELSGRYHDKGLLILTGFLMETFATRAPLAMTASITLEQSYDEVDGDSASTAEIYSLLSALSGIPIRQDLAATGSMNQKGQVQAVGGVNEKIEGFFDLCTARELTGRQGVILPAANLPHLMLRPDVVEAVAGGRFHIYAIDRVEEGAELLMGLPCGARNGDGRFSAETLFGRVQDRLSALTDASRDFLPWRRDIQDSS